MALINGDPWNNILSLLCAWFSSATSWHLWLYRSLSFLFCTFWTWNDKSGLTFADRIMSLKSSKPIPLKYYMTWSYRPQRHHLCVREWLKSFLRAQIGIPCLPDPAQWGRSHCVRFYGKLYTHNTLYVHLPSKVVTNTSYSKSNSSWYQRVRVPHIYIYIILGVLGQILCIVGHMQHCVCVVKVNVWGGPMDPLSLTSYFKWIETPLNIHGI